MTPTIRHTLRDTSGASIIIALAFFLICGIIGSVVITAASINAKAVATHKETQRIDYSVSSAAQVVASLLTPITVEFEYEGESTTPKAGKLVAGVGDGVDLSGANVPKLANAIWTNAATFGNIWTARTTGTSFTIGSAKPEEAAANPPYKLDAKTLYPTYVIVTIDRDFNYQIELSKDAGFSSSSGYNETITIPCVPTYDNKGKLLKCAWDSSSVVIQKTGSLQQGATP